MGYHLDVDLGAGDVPAHRASLDSMVTTAVAAAETVATDPAVPKAQYILPTTAVVTGPYQRS